jgi:site-specific DNA recombinase
MKVALYIRVAASCPGKDGGVASQTEALRSYAQKEKHEVAEDYVCCDDGHSGASLARPGLDRLRDGAQAGAFDAVLVLSPDRLSRKYAHWILLVEERTARAIPAIFPNHPLSMNRNEDGMSVVFRR